MLSNNLEDRIEANEKRIKELTIALENWETEYNLLLQEMDTDLETLTAKLENPDNFDPQTWAFMEEQKKALDEKFASLKEGFSNPKQTKKTYDDLRDYRPHWIPVR